MKKNIRISLTFNDFKKELKSKPWRYSLTVILIFFLLTLPGQNYYQTLGIVKKEPQTLKIPLNIPQPALYPLKTEKEDAPEVTAESVIVIDLGSQVILFSKSPHKKLLPASTTKIMTAVVARKFYPENGILTAWESVSESTSDASLMGLSNGDRVTTKALLYGLLLNSGADAAETLSQNFPGGKKAFLEEMNNTAANLHLNDSHFTNETGLDDINQYTSVVDLARLTAFAMKNPLFSQIVQTKEFNAFDITGKKKYYLKNINKLLNELPGTKGVKTGYTQFAGECLVTMVERDGHKIITVILNSQDRFGETKQLVEWAFRNYSYLDFSSLRERP